MFSASSAARPFDQLGLAYQTAYARLREQQAAIEWLLSVLEPGAAALDIGCGTGMPTAGRLSAAGHRVTGIDVSATMVRLARSQVPGAVFENIDVRTMPDPPAPWDAVTAFFSLLQMSRRDLRTVLAKVASWLAPGGCFVFATVPVDCEGLAVEWLGQRIHISSYSEPAYAQLLLANGLQIVHQRSSVFHPDYPEQGPEQQAFFYARKPASLLEATDRASSGRETT